MAKPAHPKDPATRICEVTGLALSAGPAVSFRISRASYGPVKPQERDTADDRAHWSRFDTPGSTLYTSSDRRVAFLEMLAPYRTDIAGERRALQKSADYLGLELDDVWAKVVRDWDENSAMKASWLPRTFREGRQIHKINLPTGWWIDITANETITALHDLFPIGWSTTSGLLNTPLTLSHLTGEDRTLTTAIADKLRDSVTLDDGTLPLGIRFISKHGIPVGGSGLCWAYWMRELDSSLPPAPTATSTDAIRDDDVDLVAVQRQLKIKTR